MSNFLRLATILSLAACQHAHQPPARPLPPSAPTSEPVPAIEPARHEVAPAAPAVTTEEPAEPSKPCAMTRAGTCWGEKPKIRVTKKPQPAEPMPAAVDAKDP